MLDVKKTWAGVPSAASRAARAAARRAGSLVVLAGAVALPLGMSVYNAWRDGTAAPVKAQRYNIGANAVWIDSGWVLNPGKDGEIDGLARGMKTDAASVAFIACGGLDSQGRIDAMQYGEADRIVKRFKAANPDAALYAWIRDRKPGDERAAAALSDPNVRQNVVREADYLTGALGFQGVHLDARPGEGDWGAYLQLLDELKGFLGEKPLSVSVYEQGPLKGPDILRDLAAVLPGLSDGVNVRRAAKRADQVVLIVEDPAGRYDWRFGSVVARKTRRALKSAGKARVFASIPVPGEARGECSEACGRNVINGVTRALKSKRLRARFAGLTLEAANSQTALDAQWRAYRRYWLAGEASKNRSSDVL